MYNRYIPENTNYVPAGQEDVEQPERRPTHERQEQQPTQNRPQHQAADNAPGRGGTAGQSPFNLGGFKIPAFLTGKDGLSTLFSSKEGKGVSGLLKGLKLGDFDSGDILLLLIILFLLAEGDDLELVIALGLVLIMGLGEGNKDKDKDEDAT